MAGHGKRGRALTEKLIQLSGKKSKIDDSRVDELEDESKNPKTEEQDESKYKSFSGETADDYFKRILDISQRSDVFFEWQLFLKKLPIFENNDLREINESVRKHLNINEIETQIAYLDFQYSDTNINHTPVLDAKLGFSLNIICPPSKTCPLCGKVLVNRYIKLRFIWPCKSDCRPIFPKMQQTD